MKVTVFATFDVIGMHHWPEAPAAVAYLRDSHRHAFKFKVEAVVDHNDRDIEFHTLQLNCVSMMMELFKDKILPNAYVDFGAMSCEHIATALLEAMPELTAVECWEDGENGARVAR